MAQIKPEDCYCAGWYRGPGECAPEEGHHSECPVPRLEAKHAAELATLEEARAQEDAEAIAVIDPGSIELPSAASFAAGEEDLPDEDDSEDSLIDTCENCGADVDLRAQKKCDNCGAWIMKALEGTHWRDHKDRKATHPEPPQTIDGHLPKGIERDEKGRPVFGRNAAGDPVCYSRIPRRAGRTDEDVAGRYCQSTERMLNGRCYRHGGNSPAGFASASYQGKGGGRYRAGLSVNLLAVYEQALSDPELLALDEEIAVATAVLNELNEQYKNGGDGGRLWQDLKDCCNMITLARQDTNVKARNARIAKLMNRIMQIVAVGDVKQNTRREIKEYEDLIRKLKASEAKRRRELQLMMPVQEAMMIYTSLTESVVMNLSDNSLFAEMQGAMKAFEKIMLAEHSAGLPDKIKEGMNLLRSAVLNVSTRPILSRIETDFRRIVGSRAGKPNTSTTTG